MKSREEYTKFSLDELKEKLAETQEEYDNLLIQKATHQLTNPLRLRFVRRDIARVKTFIRQHELGINVKTENA
jgi:large subunit ribosomal protein L29